jgi:16S rRNA (cytosine1402-N4)-methyltransferase
MHIPVLQKEVIEYLAPKTNENFVDCTFGQGGHSSLLLERNGPGGKVLGIEADPELYKKLQTGEALAFPEKLLKRLILVNNSYVNLNRIVEENEFKPVHGILLDLGMSSWHLEESKRGFSFLKDELLDMRYNPGECSYSASEIVNSWSEQDIVQILKDYGQERFAKSIARRIAAKRAEAPIRTTFDLKEAVRQGVPGWYQNKKLHFATKTFQALRIIVNSEIENLKKVLVQAAGVLEKEGRLAVISFHSLEDGLVKKFFKRSQEINILEILTKKPIVPGEEEIKINPRSRSAKLRIVKKIV